MFHVKLSGPTVAGQWALVYDEIMTEHVKLTDGQRALLEDSAVGKDGGHYIIETWNNQADILALVSNGLIYQITSMVKHDGELCSRYKVTGFGEVAIILMKIL